MDHTGLEIAVVGMAGRFPGARDLDEFWSNLSAGVESIRFFSDQELLQAGVTPEVLANPCYVKARGWLQDAETFDASLFGFSPREAELIDPQHRLLLEIAWHALEDAGYDSERFRSPIGLYAGVSQSSYFLHNIFNNPNLDGSAGWLQTLVGTGRDFVTTRVSYKLHLNGPSITVQSACSTSLVAVHLACQGLLSGECDLALAGGASLRVPHDQGYFYQPGGIASPDGHCRTFDKQAAGTVGGDGAGVVALKRLEDALADGDRIRAVIRGSAVNNDGAYRAGYTAPSVQGQSRVIRAALATAEVRPESIGYVEAHGSATPLGDPTEVEALKQVFCNGSKQSAEGRSCGLGSVKTNIGHLDAAAGVASLIKTVLCLEEGQMAPSLNFEQPNPQIRFEGSPFFVSTALTPWPGNGAVRRAGVSSFGLGGTNAHLVVEQAPERGSRRGAETRREAEEGEAGRRSACLLVWSGHTEETSERVGDQLAGRLEKKADLDLADAAFTLQVGRRALRHRRMLVAKSRQDAAKALSSRDPKRILRGLCGAGKHPVFFLFSGLGDHYVGMGRQLYQQEPAFRQAIDQCCQILQPQLGLDLREALYPAQQPAKKGSSQPDLRAWMGRSEPSRTEADQRLDQTALAQPAVFVLGYALCKLWEQWGIRPAGAAGYSLGEYLAACQAGVLTLEDALRLVAERARLIQQLPPGGMLAVPLSASDAQQWLGQDLSLAATNAPSLSVLAGPPQALDELQERLSQEGLASRRLRTMHAFHSAMMKGVAESFAQLVSQVSLRPPEFSYLSNVTGEWIQPEEATEPDYWVRHLCGTVRFSEGLQELLRTPGSILLEVGPGQTLSTFARQHPDEDPNRAVIASLPAEDDGRPEAEFLAGSLGRLWLAGAEVDWEGGNKGQGHRRVALPLYPFQRQRYWVERVGRESSRGGAEAQREAEEGQRVRREKGPRHQRPHLANVYVAPRDEDEETVCGILQELLGVGEVGVHDNFFELGGHSLLATQIVARFLESFAVEVPLRTFSDAPTAAEMVEAIRQLRRQDAGRSAAPQLPRIQPDAGKAHQPFPLTDVQRAYWVGRSEKLELGNVATQSYLENDLEGIDLQRYERAWQRLIDRHPMLRVIFLADGRQKILEKVPPFRLKVLDLRGQDPEQVAEKLEELRQTLSHQMLPTDQWPLFDIRATLLDGGIVRLHKNVDYLVFDAGSADILAREHNIFYQDPEADLPPLEVTFRDYVLAEATLQDSEFYLRSRQYWMDRLEDLPPAPDLPLAASPGAIAKPRFVRYRDRLDRQSWQTLQARSRRMGLTPTGLVLAAFSEVLARWSSSPRFTLNLTVFNRLPLHPQVENLVGDFSSLSLLAVDASQGESFQERARSIQRRLWDDLDHRFFSGVQVMRELALRQGGLSQALMPVVVTSTINLNPDSGPAPQPVPDGQQEAHVYSISQTPQVWIDHQIYDQGGRLSYNWDCVDGLFPEGMLEAMFEAYQALLQRLAEDEEAWNQQHFNLTPPRQIEQRAAVNATQASGGEQELLHTLFLQQALANGQRPALICRQRSIRYDELLGASINIGQSLHQAGAQPNSLVGVVMEKGWEQVAAVLGILFSGAAYLPIDASLPRRRIHELIEHGQVDWVLTQPRVAESLEWPEGIELLTIQEEMLRPLQTPLEGWHAHQKPADLAYVIYTSGSTGFPKGVMIDHRGAVNTLLDINRRFGIGSQDRVLALSSLSFDLSVYDIFGILAAGGTIVLPPAEAGRDPALWADWVARRGVTVWNTVPALLQMLADYAQGHPQADLSNLRLALLSGDWIPVPLPDQFRALAPDAQLISLGGATEASIWSICYPVQQVDPEWSSIPYGRPLDNQRFHVLDERLEPCPDWVPGELYIGGIGVAQGYWREEEKTAASFIRHPQSGERLYRTGDLGRWLPEGNIEFLGRQDFQVKIQGYRVELGEIEAVLRQHPEVAAAVVTALGEEKGSKKLAAYAVRRSQEAVRRSQESGVRNQEEGSPESVLEPTACSLQPTALSAFLEARLPRYMVPSTFAFLKALPLSANGKVDRSALPDPLSAEVAEAEPAPPEEGIEARVRQVVMEALRLERLDDLQASFLQLGATSIEVIRLATLLQAEFQHHPEMGELFAMPDVAALLRYYEDQAPRQPKAPSAQPSQPDPLAAYCKVILDQEERDRFKKERPNLRRFEANGAVALESPSSDERRYLERRSCRQFGQQPVQMAQLAGLLSCLREIDLDGQPKYQYGSAGGAYPVQTYLYLHPGRVSGIESGVYYYHPLEHRLHPLSPSAEFDRSIHGWINQPIFEQAAFSIFLIAEIAAIGPFYGPVARDYCLIEAGLMSQLLEEAAPEAGLGLCQIGVGGIDFQSLRDHFDLNESHLLVHSLMGGPLDKSLGKAAFAPAPLEQEWEEGKL